LLLAVASGVLPSLAAYLTQQLVNSLAHPNSNSERAIVLLAISIGVAGGVTISLQYGAGLTGLVASRKVQRNLQYHLYRRLDSHPTLEVLETPELRDSLQIAEQATQQAPTVMTDFGSQLINRIVNILAFTGVAFTAHRIIAAALLLTTIPPVILQLILARRRAASAVETAEFYRVDQYYRSVFLNTSTAKEVKTLGVGRQLARRMWAAISSIMMAERRAQSRVTALQAGLALLNGAVVGLGVATVAIQERQTGTDPGSIVYFLAAAVAIQGAVIGLAGDVSNCIVGLRAFVHYQTIIEYPGSSSANRYPVGPLTEAIEIEDVWFKYPGQSQWALRGVSMSIRLGEHIVIVGDNGAGKSTIVKLLLGLYECDRGRITWDGVDIRQLDRELLRRQYSCTYQDFGCYEMPLADNVSMGDWYIDASAQQVKNALTRADSSLGGGDSRVHLPTLLATSRKDNQGSPGTTLSGGQWQKVALARSMYRTSASVLILDEPNSSLDPLSELRVYKALDSFARGKTAIYVSHRLAVVKSTDMIIVMENGGVVESGSHQKLISLEGKYKAMYGAQAARYVGKAN